MFLLLSPPPPPKKKRKKKGYKNTQELQGLEYRSVAGIRISPLFEEKNRYILSWDDYLLSDLFLIRIMSKTLLKIVVYNNRSRHRFLKSPK